MRIMGKKTGTDSYQVSIVWRNSKKDVVDGRKLPDTVDGQPWPALAPNAYLLTGNKHGLPSFPS